MDITKYFDDLDPLIYNYPISYFIGYREINRYGFTRNAILERISDVKTEKEAWDYVRRWEGTATVLLQKVQRFIDEKSEQEDSKDDLITDENSILNKLIQKFTDEYTEKEKDAETFKLELSNYINWIKQLRKRLEIIFSIANEKPILSLYHPELAEDINALNRKINDLIEKGDKTIKQYIAGQAIDLFKKYKDVPDVDNKKIRFLLIIFEHIEHRQDDWDFTKFFNIAKNI
jgi:hypothetical protein